MPGDADRHKLDVTMAEIARETGAALSACPRPGHAVRRVILRDSRDDRGTEFDAAQVEDDGTLRISGHDVGPGVSESFGPGVSSYEWVYVVPPGRVSTLCAIFRRQDDGDVLAALEAYYGQHGGQLHDLLTSPDVSASFSNWHS